MRLSDVLSKAPVAAEAQVEGFLGARRIGWGRHRMIEVGKVGLNFHCKTCGAVRTFNSEKKLSCLVVADRVVSIDACLRCSSCESAVVEAWFLLVSRDSLYDQAPTVRLQRYVEHRRGVASRVGVGAGGFDDLVERAQLAYEERLGAGAMIYLRKIFEALTRQVADVAGISTELPSGKRKPFRPLLEQVDAMHHIIPPVFASDGYRLFSELSEVIHGDSSEEVALEKYLPCRSLILGVVNNVVNNQEMKQAIEALGWDVEGWELPAGGGTAV